MTASETSSEKRIIAIPFAFEDGVNSGANLNKSEALGIYTKNMCVAAISAKHCNPDCTVAIVTNICEEKLDSEYLDVLRRNDIELIVRPFDKFCFSKDYPWSLAFYKICALNYLTEAGYDKICYLDADTYTQGSINKAWKECEDGLILFKLRKIDRENNEVFYNELQAFYGEKTEKTYYHYGGEFFLANNDDAKQFLKLAQNIYQKMIDDGFITKKGDEFIVSLTANETTIPIKHAGKYIHRYWTSLRDRNVPDNYRNNPVAILHLPAEKEVGLIQLYNKFFKKGVIPERELVWKICSLDGLSPRNRMIKLYLAVKRKIT